MQAIENRHGVNLTVAFHASCPIACPAATGAKWELIGDGEGIHWPNLDEDIEVEALVAGARSGESQRSLQRWLAARNL